MSFACTVCNMSSLASGRPLASHSRQQPCASRQTHRGRFIDVFCCAATPDYLGQGRRHIEQLPEPVHTAFEASDGRQLHVKRAKAGLFAQHEAEVLQDLRDSPAAAFVPDYIGTFEVRSMRNPITQHLATVITRPTGLEIHFVVLCRLAGSAGSCHRTSA